TRVRIQPDEIVEIDVVKIKFEIGIIVASIYADRSTDRDQEQCLFFQCIPVETTWIDMAPDCQESLDEVGAWNEVQVVAAIGFWDPPIVPPRIFDHARDKLANRIL